MELGGRQLRLPGWVSSRLPSWRPPSWRPSRAAGVLAAVALVVGLAAGYAAGHDARGGTALPGAVRLAHAILA